MKLIFTIIALFSVQLLSGQTYNGPESAEYDYANHRWLISNTSSHQVLARDSNGVLSVFTGALTSGPYGIEIVGDTLYCCSGSSIKGFLLSDGSAVFSLNLGATFLNGLTHDFNGNLYTTDYSAKTIYKINIAAISDTMVASNLVQSPNGIIFDEYNNRCVFVNWGSNAPIKAIDLSSFAVTTVTATTLGSCDGIARDGQGRYYVSNWTGQSVVRFDSSFSSPPVIVASSLHSPADIFYNVVDDTLAIPNSGNNTVDFIGFGTVSVPEIDYSEIINVYPNPAGEFLKFKVTPSSDFSEIVIFDVSGKKCIGRKLNDSENYFELNLSSLNAGEYLIYGRIENKNIFIRKFIKA